MQDLEMVSQTAFLVSHGLPIAVANIGGAQALAGFLIDRDALGVAPVAVGVARSEADLNFVSHASQQVLGIGR